MRSPLAPLRDCVLVLNLDAEIELADPDGHRRSARLRDELRRRGAVFSEEVERATGVAPRVLPLDGPPAPPGPPGAQGAAWCPTPSALARLQSAGLRLAECAPTVDVLRRANHREFGLALATPDDFPGARFCTTRAECDAAWSRAPRARWLLKRPLGFAGRGRKVVVPADLSPPAARWIDASLAGSRHAAGLCVEPLVDRLADFALHGVIAGDGRVLGTPTVQQVDSDGRWSGSRQAVAGDLGPTEERALLESGERVAAALRATGYVGPFGIDAFRWRDAAGNVRFRALCEVNARYTMGFCRGFTSGVSSVRSGSARLC
ncbi:MAG: hypothetical protein IPM29_29880 [Planctomycetes bacterium]|nr:hypothetical protein [Planctomycetota bacterium]